MLYLLSSFFFSFFKFEYFCFQKTQATNAKLFMEVVDSENVDIMRQS